MAKNEQTKPQAKPEAPKVDDGLVEMVSQTGDTLRVHPTTVEEHRGQGWKVVE